MSAFSSYMFCSYWLGSALGKNFPSLSVTLNSLWSSHLYVSPSLKLSPLCFTAIGPWSSTSLPSKLDVTDPPANLLSRTPKPPICLRSTLSSTSLLSIYFRSVVSVFFIYMLGIFDLGITSKKMMDILFSAGTGVPYFPFQLGGSGDKTEITSNVVNDFFFLFFQFIILDAIIFLLFLLNEKFCHLILEHPFVLIQSIHEWI